MKGMEKQTPMKPITPDKEMVKKGKKMMKAKKVTTKMNLMY